MWLKGPNRGGQEAEEWRNPGKQRRGHEGGRKEGWEERKEELLLQGIQLSRNVLTIMSHTVGWGWGWGALWEAVRRWHHLFKCATDCKWTRKSQIIKVQTLWVITVTFQRRNNSSPCANQSQFRLEAWIHPHTAAVGIYFSSSYTMSTSAHTASVGKVIGKPWQIVYLWTWQEWAVVLELVCLQPQVLSAVYSYNRQNMHKDKWRWRRAEGGRAWESTGSGDSESEAIWKVISSVNAIYLFINERKVFTEPSWGKTFWFGEMEPIWGEDGNHSRIINAVYFFPSGETIVCGKNNH